MLSSIKKISLLITVIYCSVGITGCKKYLDAKQDQALIVPETIQDLQSLLDDYFRINDNYPETGEISADDYYITDNDWSGLDEYLRRMYTWEKENLFRPGNNNEWVNQYNNIYKSNVVLFNIDKINRTSGDENDWNNTKGSALFLRATEFAQIAWIWSLAYDQNTALTDLGVPLRIDPNFNIPSIRANVQQTYDQIIKDFKEAAQLLPTTPKHVFRPSKPAAYAWLARTYLSMRKYDSALVYSDKTLQLFNTLMDYNTLNLSNYPVIKSFNPEVIYHTTMSQPIYPGLAFVDTVLYSYYQSNDLRKFVMWDYSYGFNKYAFRGSYDGDNWEDSYFNGIASDEVYLMRAESHARTGNVSEAMNDLNTLLIKRWMTGTFVPFTASNATDALNKILLERRKELHFRGLRWMDIKRLNKEGANITLKRIINGQTYTLPPNDPKYALPIPEDVIAISGMPQNPR